MKRTLWAVLVLGALAIPGWAQNYDEGDDPEHGVARLSLMNGDVSVQRGDTGEVVAGELNAPLVALDHILTGSGSRAEVQFDWANMIRLGPASEVRLGELSDGNYWVQVAEGTTTFRILRDTKARVEISTPTVSVRPVDKGVYRVTVRPDGVTEVTVRDGQAEIFTPRGTETLRSGKTLQARGTAADPEYMILSAINKDDWDRWNEDRDRDINSGDDSYKYVSSSIPGANDLNGNGRWVYDSPYGWVWVPNVSSTWAPYRVGRWSWVNYYGWTWISGDPWGWAPYHYGNWYSSPYGWAWYPGAYGYRYYWRPALVGFFGWGNVGVAVGVGYGGFGYGNIGWVPLAPHERFRPWYGRGYNNTFVNNNITVVNNTNITNVYRNARVFNGRNGVTSINASGFVRANNNDLTRAGQVQGQIPFNQDNREARRFSDRAPGQETASRANRQSPQFATAGGGTGVAGGNGPDRSVANVGGGNGNRGVDRGAANVDRGNRGAPSTAGVSRDAGALNNPAPAQNGGWRRFDPSTANTTNDRTGFSTRGAENSPRQATDAAPVTRQNEPRNGGFADRRATMDRGVNQSGVNPGSTNVPYDRGSRGSVNQGPVNQAPSNNGGFGSRRGGGGQQPVQINPPIVRDRGGSGGGNPGGGVYRSAPPQQGAPPSGSGGTIRGGGGGNAGPRGAAPAGNSGGGNPGGGGGGRRR